MAKPLWLLLMFLLPLAASAQSISNYAFSTTTTGSLSTDLNGNTVDMSTGTTTLIGPNQNSTASTAENIGFDFWNMGTRHTTFNASSHGLLGLTTTIGTGNNIAGGAGLRIGALVGGTSGTSMATSATGKVHYKVVGTAPNRVLVVEWKDMSITSSSTTADATFQVRLYENTGAIEMVYGDMNVGTGSISTVRTGFSTATTVYNMVNTSTHTNSTTAVQDNTYAAGPMTNLTSTTDGNRRTYLFTPAPVAAPTTLAFSNVGAGRLTLSWTDNSTNEVSFAVFRSTDNINFTQVTTGASTSTATTGTVYSFNDLTVNPSTTYYYRVIAIAEGTSPALSGSQATTAGTVCGTKSVGPTGDYLTLTAAMADLQLNGLSCPVVLELQPAYTSAGETFPITVGNVPTSAANTLTIRPQAGATNLLVTSASAGGTINLTNARFITLDGRPGGTGTSRELTIQNTYAGNDNIQANAIKFISDANNNAVRYCHLKSQNNATSTNYGSTVLFLTSFVGFNPLTGNSNNIVENCNIGPVNPASAFPTYGVVSSGAAATPNVGNIIRNNNIFDFFHAANASAGVYLLAGSSDFTVSGNNFYQTQTRTATSANTHYGIWINAGANGNNFMVADNFIGGSAAGATGTAWTLTHGTTSLANRFVGINFSGGTTTASTFQNN
ncbi:MAG: fibronectin type III domain-containing protein, partial [Hymenobacteraceae bacterium]|nr:fibronectin type III domain-containing protein [Hymenobacteraceae bacterium]